MELQAHLGVQSSSRHYVLCRLPAPRRGKGQARDPQLQSVQLLSDGQEDHPLFTRAAPSDPAVLFLRTHAETLRAIRTLNDPKGIYLTCPLRLERR